MKHKISLIFLCTLLSYTIGAIYNLITVDKTLSITPYTTVYSKFIQRCNSICHYDLECRSFEFTKTSDSEGICSFFDVYAYPSTDQSMALTVKTGAKLYSKIPLKDLDSTGLQIFFTVSTVKHTISILQTTSQNET